MLLGTTIVNAASTMDDKAAAATDQASNSVKKPGFSAPNANAKAKAKEKASAKVKLVDINGSNKAALMKLPGITSADADKIIANRPYGSKTWLANNGIISDTTYFAIRSLIEAKQPFKTGAENVAFYEKLKKERAEKAAKAKP